MWLQLLIVTVAFGVNNAQTENAVVRSEDNLRQLNVLAEAMVQLSQHPIYRPPLLRYFYALAKLPQYRAKVIQIFNYLRFPLTSNVVLTNELVREIVTTLRHPYERDFLIDAFLTTLAAHFRPIGLPPDNSPWPDVPEPIHPLARLITPLLQDPPFFQTVAYQITQLLQDPQLKSIWIQFILKFETPLENRKAMLRALYTLIDIPEAKPFVVHTILLTLQHPDLRPLFMKQFLEMLLSRTIPTRLAMQMLKVLYSPMPNEDMVPEILRVLEEPRIRYRITGMVLNILFEPRLRPTVLAILLDVVEHPMFFPIVLYHTQQILIHLVNDPQQLDYVLAILRLPQARPLANKFILLFLRQPVQVSYLQALMQQDDVLNQFFREVLNEREVRPVATSILNIKYLLSNPNLYARLIPYVDNVLRSPIVRVYVSSYLLNLLYQPSLASVMQRLLPDRLVQKMQSILLDEVNEKQVYVQTIKFQCERVIRIFNPQTQIPAIPLPNIVQPEMESMTAVPIALPIPIQLPPVIVAKPKPVAVPLPAWVVPRPVLAPGPFCPPPMVIREPVYVPIVPEIEEVPVIISNILTMTRLRNYDQVYDTIRKLLMNPLTQHQGILKMLEQPLLRPILIDVLRGFAEQPQLMSTMSATLLAAFRKVAQDTVVFRDVLRDSDMFGKFQEILAKMARPELQSEMLRFWQDFITNSGAEPDLQQRVMALLNDKGMARENLEQIGMSLRNG